MRTACPEGRAFPAWAADDDLPGLADDVYLFFEQDTLGTVLVDNIEWHRD